MGDSQRFATSTVLANLSQTEEWLQLALTAARMGTWEWNIASGEVYWSKNVEAIFGLKTGTFGRTFNDFHNLIHPDDVPGVDADLKRTLDGKADNVEIIYRIRWPDGSLRWMEGRGRVVRDGQGKPERMLGTVADITSRMQKEQRAKTYADIVEHLEMGLYVYHLEDETDDRTLTLIAANPAAEKLLRIPNSHVLSQRIDAILPGLRERGIPQALADVVRIGESREYVDFEYGDDRVVNSVWSFRAFPLPNRCVGVCFESITERKRLETRLIQAHKLEGIGRLAGGVAHDFNNLLTGILGYVEIIKMSLPPNSPLQDACKEVFGAGERAKNLTHQLLAFARRQVVEPQVLNVNRLIRDFTPLLSRMMREDIEIVHQLHDDPLCVKIDPGQFEQILMNLAINARDAMPSGGKLTIHSRRAMLSGRGLRDLPRGEYVALTISDSGMGIDPEVLPRIFEPFFTTKSSGIGTGLGLATVHGIITQNGGHIDCESIAGEGASFRIHLPAAKAEQEVVAQKKERPAAVPHGTETVLLVEDEELVRSVAAQTLRTYGYTVLDCADADTALAQAHSYGGHIHLLLTDVVMPRVGGAELARRIQEQWPRVKVLYTSGYTDNTIVRQGVQDKELEFLPKPYTPSTLARKVREVLNG